MRCYPRLLYESVELSHRGNYCKSQHYKHSFIYVYVAGVNVLQMFVSSLQNNIR